LFAVRYSLFAIRYSLRTFTSAAKAADDTRGRIRSAKARHQKQIRSRCSKSKERGVSQVSGQKRAVNLGHQLGQPAC
jgi:hypothetical protein